MFSSKRPFVNQVLACFCRPQALLAVLLLLCGNGEIVLAGSGYRPVRRNDLPASDDSYRPLEGDRQSRRHGVTPQRRERFQLAPTDVDFNDSSDPWDRVPQLRARRNQRDFDAVDDGDGFGLLPNDAGRRFPEHGHPGRNLDPRADPARDRARQVVPAFERPDTDEAWRGQLAPAQELISRRYRDPAVLSFLNSVSSEESLAMYAETLDLISQRHLSPPSPEQLVRRGMFNLVEALRNSDFVAVNRLPANAGSLPQFEELLVQQFQQARLSSTADAVAVLQATMQLSQQLLGLAPSVIGLEFEYAAVEALDQFSAFIPPQAAGRSSAVLERGAATTPEQTVEAGQMLDRTTGYVRLSSFGVSSSAEMQEALSALADQGMQSLIIDLRGNPGGLLSSAIEISRLFLRQGTIVSTRGRNAEDDSTETASSAKTWNLPLVVLVDEHSASASEILAAAIQENGRGAIVGGHTYGKGTVQTLFPLKTARASLRLTTARFYSPTGRAMAGTGVEPDVPVNSGETSGIPGRDGAILTGLAVIHDAQNRQVTPGPFRTWQGPNRWRGERHLSAR